MQSFVAAATGDEPVGLIARLTRSERLIKRELARANANRLSFEFDSINSELTPEYATETIEGRRDRTNLAHLKILTTMDNFKSLTRMDDIRDGQWYFIKLFARGSRQGPFAWASSLGEAGYEENVPLTLNSIRFLFSEDERPLSPAGADVPAILSTAQIIANKCRFPDTTNNDTTKIKIFLEKISRPHAIIVRDVGQASFCSAIDLNRNEIFHLDAGWPISYNKNTAILKPKLNINNAPVILSHWDWDHLHGYHAVAGLAQSTWIAPIQTLGPGAALVANTLAADDRLLGFLSGTIKTKSLILGKCRGPSGNMNQTGLWTIAKLQSGKSALFVGDAAYDFFPSVRFGSPNFIVATHHGANFSGNVVAPYGNDPRCVVSVGKGNCYGHPSQSAIAKHTNVGWAVQYTCDQGSVVRGDRQLGP